MTIGFLSSSTGWGGLEQNLLRHARWMLLDGHEVIIFAVSGTPLWTAASEMNRTAIDRFRRYLNHSDARRMAHGLRAAEVDVLWSRDPRDLSAAGRAAMLARIPFVFQQGMQLSGPKLMPWHRTRYGRVTKWVAPLQWLKAQVETWTPVPPERVAVIPLGLEQRWFDPPMQRMAARSACELPFDKRLVGCFGRLDALKGQDTLIRALQHLPTIWEAVIVGDNTVNDERDMRAELEQLAKSCGVADRVHFRAAMADLRPAYDAVDVVAICSEAETIGMVTLEAMAAGCAVVGTKSGGTPELFLHGRVNGRALWGAGDEAGLALSIEQGPFRADRKALETQFSEQRVREQWQTLLNSLPTRRQKP